MRNPPTRRPGQPEPPRRDRDQAARRDGPGVLGWLQRLFVGGALAALVGWVLLFYVFAPQLPDPRELRRQSSQPTVTVLAADGSVLARRGAEGARFVELPEISPWLTKAVVATEDARFWRHFGVDVWGLGRATLANIRAGGVVQGGSTITQQLAKNLYVGNERSLARKLEELVYAVWLETQLSKEQILTLYLNRVYFGAGATGVEAAAQRYFAKPAKELSLNEAAMIAGLLKAPSRLAPTNDLDQARDRAGIVLARMVDAGYLSAEEATAARMKPARLAPDQQTVLAGHFVDWALDGLRRQLGKAEEDIVVTTTIDPSLQKAAQAAVEKLLDAKAAERGATQAAVVLMDKGGAIRALVGGRSYSQSAFNRATDAKRQPGSAFKPFVYLAALEEGMSPEKVYADRPVRIGDWEPRNYTGKFLGDVTAAKAFAESINTVAVVVTERTGRKDVIEVARRLGIVSPLEPVPSLPLGTFEVTLLELTGAYQPIAAGGLRRPVHGVTAVADGRGRTLYRHAPSEVRVLDRRVDAMMQELMVAVVEQGTGKAARLGDRRAAGKTGTTNAARDAWFVGFSGDYVAGVWVGNDEGKPMRGVSGSTLPAQIWRQVMLATPKPAPAVAQADTTAPSVPEAVGQKAQDGLDWLLDRIERTFGRLTQ
jgi:penicillin-binding protein 1A